MAVTVESLIAKGYPVGGLKTPAHVTLAEADIKIAYFPTDTDFTELDDLVHALTFGLLLRRRLVATRFGTVTKLDGYSQTVEAKAVTEEIIGYCYHRYKAWREVSQYNDFTDILGLFIF